MKFERVELFQRVELCLFLSIVPRDPHLFRQNSWLAQDLQDILQNEKEIRKEFESQPRRLSFLHNIIHDLNRSKQRLQGNQLMKISATAFYKFNEIR